MNTFIVAKYTYRELIKSKILLNVVIVALFLSIISFVATEFTFGVPQRVALDFGLGVASLSSIVIAIFMGVGLIKHEIENRTLYMVLSKPIRRVEFLLGKIVGLEIILFINIVVMSAMTLGYYFILGGTTSSTLIFSIFFIFLESSLVLLMAIFFSLVSNSVLAVIFTISVYIASFAISEVKNLIQTKNSVIFSFFVKILNYVLPDLSVLNIKQFVIYKQELDGIFLLKATSYGFIYLVILFLLSMVIFERKNLD